MELHYTSCKLARMEKWDHCILKDLIAGNVQLSPLANRPFVGWGVDEERGGNVMKLPQRCS